MDYSFPLLDFNIQESIKMLCVFWDITVDFKEVIHMYLHGSTDAVLKDGEYVLLPPSVTGVIQEEGRKILHS